MLFLSWYVVIIVFCRSCYDIYNKCPRSLVLLLQRLSSQISFEL